MCLINVIETHFTPNSFIPYKDQYLLKKSYKFPLLDIVKIEITKLRIITFVISFFPSALYFVTKNFLLNNMFGILFAITGIE